MEEVLQQRLKEHEAQIRSPKSYTSSQSTSPSTLLSRASSVDIKRRCQGHGEDYLFSPYLDSPGKERFILPLGDERQLGRTRRHLLLILAIIGVVVLFVSSIAAVTRSGSSRTVTPSQLVTGHSGESYFHELYKTSMASPGVFPYELKGTLVSDRCSICDCSVVPNIYNPAPEAVEFFPRARHDDVFLDNNQINMNEYMRQTILDLYCSRQHLSNVQAYKLARRTANHLSEMMSWSLASLQHGKPTVYLTTATSPNGKAGDYRPQYFRRTSREIRKWLKEQEDKAKADHPGWQVVWIVAEDEVDIDPQIVKTLRRSGIPYVYFAYGLTRSWGNAQKNAVMQMVYALSRPKGGVFGHGPVYGLDDDNKILPGLLDMLVKVQRVGVFPIGNLGELGFEDPLVDAHGEVVGSGSLWQPQERRFPFDFGAFAYNSSMLGTQISGPTFWKHIDFAGESEFIGQLVNKFGDLEPLCGRQMEQSCHYVWHNEKLVDVEKLTDEEETKYIEAYGVPHYHAVLAEQARERDANRGSEYIRPDGIRPGAVREGVPMIGEDGSVELVWVEMEA